MTMERHEIIGLMTELKLAGMRHAYDEVIADAARWIAGGTLLSGGGSSTRP